MERLKRSIAVLLLLTQLMSIGGAETLAGATQTDLSTQTDLQAATATDLTAEEETATATDLTAEEEAATETDLYPPEGLPEAEDLTLQCLFNGYDASHFKDMSDGKYKTFYTTVAKNGEQAVYITVPEGKEARGLVIKWRSIESMPAAVQVKNEEDEWVTIGHTAGQFIEEYCRFPAATEFRIVNAENTHTKLRISELQILSEGSLPASVHIWQEAPEEIDLMLFAGHPDDEILWFAGLLPYYAGECGKNVLVACAAFNVYYRRQELLDCLWTCGVRIYPLFLGFRDMVTSNAEYVIDQWGRGKSLKQITLAFRQYRPKVVVLHADGGESNHGVHKALNRLCKQGITKAADPEQYPNTLEAYDVPKVYVHLQQEDAIHMDWHQPLERFGGRTALEIAQEAYTCHTSQQHKSWYSVIDDGEKDSGLYGLWHTTVGADVIGSDMFENLE